MVWMRIGGFVLFRDVKASAAHWSSAQQVQVAAVNGVARRACLRLQPPRKVIATSPAALLLRQELTCCLSTYPPSSVSSSSSSMRRSTISLSRLSIRTVGEEHLLLRDDIERQVTGPTLSVAIDSRMQGF